MVHPTIVVGVWLEGRVNRRRGRVAVCGEGDLVELVEVEVEEGEIWLRRRWRRWRRRRGR